ncbi:jg9094 [Pararge aegeria aegeria]|uniref:Jg9094 protein n=1 Tax=Pararge aegeria aegeria TaxID=348720 RepID=A0A8S4RXZ9_9NEOP|nr:jg9094 [Pararge aegeria aegeria]
MKSLLVFSVVLMGMVALTITQEVDQVDLDPENPFPNNPKDFVIDEAFFINPEEMNREFEPINTGSEDVEQYPPKQYDNPMLRGKK